MALRLAPVRAARSAFHSFLALEASSGLALVAAALVALVWANSPFADAYDDLWHVQLGPLDLHHWVGDGLMAVFFFVVGLEIKRELVVGELRDPRAAALPVAAALGGMAVPAGLYLALNAGAAGGRGWGIPMATDIAFALGVVALLGTRVPSAVKLLLLALAIVDDLGAILVIAIAYSSGIDPRWLAAAVGGVGLHWLLRRVGLWHELMLLPLGGAVWWATHESGVHATIAGVALGLTTPADRCERLEHRIHPWTGHVVVPLFALAFAGVALGGDALGAEGGSRVALGIGVGLVVGKLVGVTAASWLAVRLRLAALPEGIRWTHVLGAGALAGVGFTVSLFIAELAFPADPALAAAAKVGILGASVVAAVLGVVAFVVLDRQPDVP